MTEKTVTVREARAHLADHINRAEEGVPTVITRNGAPVAAVVPIADFEALEEAADVMLAREAEAALAQWNVARVVPVGDVDVVFGQHGAHSATQQCRKVTGHGRDHQYTGLRHRRRSLLAEMQERAEWRVRRDFFDDRHGFAL